MGGDAAWAALAEVGVEQGENAGNPESVAYVSRFLCHEETDPAPWAWVQGPGGQPDTVRGTPQPAMQILCPVEVHTVEAAAGVEEAAETGTTPPV